MSKMKVLVATASIAAAVVWSGAFAHAHQQWVMPNFFTAEADQDSVWLGFEHVSGDRRFAPTQGPGPALMWVTGPTDELVAPPFVYTGKTRTLAEIELTKPGTYRLTAEEPEAYWTRLKEGDKARWVRQPRDQVAGKTIEGSKRYWAKAMAYVTFGKPTRGPLAPQGDPLELVPLDHPNAIRAGTPFQVRVLADNQPLAGHEIKVFADRTQGHDASATFKSRTDGRATLRFGRAGRYLVTVANEVAASDPAKADAHSYSVYLMVEVKGRAKRRANRAR